MTGISRILNDDNFVHIQGYGHARIYLKIEALNAAGSIKMKTALSMVDRLEREGAIKPDTILIESSSGSLGVALSIICAERGYTFVCVIDPNASEQNVKLMKAYGASTVLIDKVDEQGGYLGSRIAHIKGELLRDRRYLWLNQYANPENPMAHHRTTAPALANRFPRIDYLFVGAGTTGTLMGCASYFSQFRPETQVIAVDSTGSVTFGMAPSKRRIPGLGTSRRPEIFKPHGIAAFELVDEIDTIATCRHLAVHNGILAGGSTGTVMTAVLAWRDRMPQDAVIVAISPDLGERYLDTIYDDTWVKRSFGSVPTFSPKCRSVVPTAIAV